MLRPASMLLLLCLLFSAMDSCCDCEKHVADNTYRRPCEEHREVRLPDTLQAPYAIREVLLSETDSFAVYCSDKDFMDNLTTWINTHYYIEDDRELLKRFMAVPGSYPVINMKQLARGGTDSSGSVIKDISGRLEFRICDLLFHGKCMVINRKTKLPEKSGVAVSRLTTGSSSFEFDIRQQPVSYVGVRSFMSWDEERKAGRKKKHRPN